MRLQVRVAMLFCAVISAYAQTQPTSGTAPARLPTLVVTPTGIEDEAFAVPYTVDTLHASDFQDRVLPRTLPDALKLLPAVMVQKTAHGQGSPFIRGFTGFRTLMLNDGIRLNNSTFREGPNQYWNTIDPFTIRQLEVVKGPASILYGSDAIGGTVNALTSRSAPRAGHSAIGGRAYYRYATAEHAHVGRVEVSGNLGDRAGILVGWSEKDFGDLRAGEGTGLQPQTGYDENAADLKFEYRLASNSRLIAAYQRLRQDDAWRTHRTTFGVRWHGTTIGNDKRLALDQARDLAYLQYHHTNLGGLVDAVHVSLSYHQQDEFEHRIRSSDQTNLQGVAVNTWGTSVQLESPSSFGRWVYGVEHYRDRVDSFRENYRANGTLDSIAIQGPVADDARYDLFGAYAQNSVGVGDRGELILGARYTAAEAKAGRLQDPVTGMAISLSERWHATVGSGRILWRLDAANQWHAFGGVSQGFRAPNLSDLTRLDIARSGELEVPSTGLAPEYFTSFEAGLKVQHARFSGHAAYFYTRIDDMIDRFPADNAATTGVVEVMKANVGHGFVHGLELNGTAQLHPHWTLWGNLTAMRGEVDTFVSSAPARIARRPMSRIMPTTMNLGLRWQHPSGRLWTEVHGVAVAKQDRLSPGDATDTQRIPPGGTPGYTLLHVRAGWRWSEAFSLSAALDNVLDKNYRIHGSGLNEAGRNLIVAVDCKF